eukprot:GHVP01068415.1.p1 GENE.GHVP01068415.1~~GHVP01068415.1.p1  ORF type:complete len:908 (+),score=189.75 GHVP01068415.1:185-2725(+)
MSELFPDVVNCMQTTNIELKKLVYLYVINYAKSQPELAILCVNTLRKDSMDSNPLVRALAIRTMGCIRLPRIVQYLIDPLKKAARDADPYVRKTAAICIVKLYETAPEAVEEHKFVRLLQDMMNDAYPSVVANAVAAIHEISESSGRNLLDFSKGNLSKLLSALGECTEWGQIFLLDAIAVYDPASSKEAKEIIDRVTARLNHANPAIVMSAVKVVVKCLDFVDDPVTIRELQKKLSPSLMSLLSAEPEIQYIALRNILLIVQKRIFFHSSDISKFFCKYYDPIYVKMEKLEILVRLVSEKNVEQVLSELREYSSEVHVDFVRKSVRSIGRVAVKLEKAAEKCIAVLLELIRTKVNYVVQEAIVVMKDVFRRYPNKYESVISHLCSCLEVLDEPEAKAAIVWIIGEYAERIENPEEILASFVEGFVDEPAQVQLQVLTSSVKLYLKKRGSQNLVQKVFKLSTEMADNPDLRDRGYMYWRLLSTKPEAASSVVLAKRPIISGESYALDPIYLDKLLKHISTLASVYHKLPDTFVTKLRPMELEDESSSEDGEKVDPLQLKKEIDEAEYVSGSEGKDEADTESEESDNVEDESEESSSESQESTESEEIPMYPALQGSVPGTNGNRGLALTARVIRIHKDKTLYLQMKPSNLSLDTITFREIQVQANPFGLVPQNSALSSPHIASGKNAESLVALTFGKGSSTPPQEPLKLEVALKTSLDVFYFTVPYNFGDVIKPYEPISKEVFKQHWDRMGESRSSSQMGVLKEALSASHAMKALRRSNISVIMNREEKTFDSIFCAAVLVNNLLLLVQIDLQKGTGQRMKTTVRADSPPLLPLTHKLLFKVLKAN